LCLSGLFLKKKKVLSHRAPIRAKGPATTGLTSHGVLTRSVFTE
jgi:hypothetical protein